MRRLTNDDGSATLELAILAPALLLALSVVIMGGRIMVASNAAESVGGSAARAASLARTPGEATIAAQRVAATDLANQGLTCTEGGPSVSTDTSNWSGRPASVTVRVTCDVALSDIGMPGLPGSRTISATATSPVDVWRGQ
ncbi:pilus assembly protein [Janibacter sp. YIM B02568]|uniref:TadE/TadG family type IV pilus assembly protein n=1 Tax=Janibacter endophyticus TaxID=2806261 RepID=UPI001951A700|nr:TadE/TadG family type IV pilus assembly protein [Janibacter endophyticus]MBM6544565.1 pilus assembly protein [Janibacter endophyticus]